MARAGGRPPRTRAPPRRTDPRRGPAALANLAYALVARPSLPWAVVPIMFYGVGFAMAMPSITLTTLELFPTRRGMAASLRRKGLAPCVCDVRAEAVRDFVAEGGNGCANPAELARRCEVVISVVVNAAQTEEVLFGANGAAGAMGVGAVFVMCSTVDPAASAALERRLEAMGLLYPDAPISGGAAPGAAGGSTMTVAGRPDAYAQAAPALGAVAASVVRPRARGGPGSTLAPPESPGNSACGP